MLIDANTLDNDAEIETTVCIVGSGPAGLTLAIELLAAGTDVAVIESGGIAIEAWAQALNDGLVVGDAYAGLRNTRQRQLGGTIQAWNTPVGDEIGAKYAPLDPRDMETSEAMGEPKGWPIRYEELAAFYPRAQEICGLGKLDYGPEAMLAAGRRPFSLGNGYLVSKIYQFGRADRFLETHVRTLCSAKSAQVFTNLTVTGADPGPPSCVSSLRAVTRNGASLRIRARVFVLAGGAIENARLLLLFQRSAPDLIKDPAGWIGRCFMEHPRDNALLLLPKSPDIFENGRFYDVCAHTDGSVSCGRLAFSNGPPHGSELPNMSITLLPRTRAPKSWLERLWAHRKAQHSGGYNWSSIDHPERRFDAFRLLVNMEQRPRFENRIVLCDEKDALGQPRAALHWRLNPEEQSSVHRLRALIADELQGAGIGSVQIDHSRRPDPNAHHHAGTTRMAETSLDGVVDRDCRVFATENLYVAGASIFPTAGFANPTLTIVAMASRLAAHVRGRLP